MTRREALLPVALSGMARGLSAAARWDQAVLVHEHVLVDFIGADRIVPGRYDPDEVFRVALPHVRALAALGCRRLQECTPNFLGRDPRLLRKLADATGLEIWTNTGLYAAGDHRFLPDYAKRETADDLARRWLREVESGVDGMKPKFVKIGVNRGPLPEWDRTLVRAAAVVARETGLTVASHTGDGAAAREQVALWRETKAPLKRFVWVHAQNERDPEIHAEVARAGAWVEFDGISPKSADWHLTCVQAMASRGLLGKTLVSQDAGWFHVGEPGGGQFRGYTYLFTDFLPRLPEADARRLVVQNPVEAFG